MTLRRNENGPVIVGHRGAGRGLVATALGEVRENTIESFLAAHDAGARWVETDAVRTRDGGLVLHHDTVLTDGQPILGLTTAEAHELGMVSLTKAFNALPSELAMIVEVKHVLDDAAATNRCTAMLVSDALIEERTRSGRQLTTYGFDPSTVTGVDVQSLSGYGVSVGTLLEGGSDLAAMVVTAARQHLEVVAAHTSSLLGERAERQLRPYSLAQVVERSHRLGQIVLAWCPSIEECRVLERAGVDAFCVDDVPTFLSAWGK